MKRYYVTFFCQLLILRLGFIFCSCAGDSLWPQSDAGPTLGQWWVKVCFGCQLLHGTGLTMAQH